MIEFHYMCFVEPNATLTFRWLVLVELLWTLCLSNGCIDWVLWRDGNRGVWTGVCALQLARAHGRLGDLRTAADCLRQVCAPMDCGRAACGWNSLLHCL